MPDRLIIHELAAQCRIGLLKSERMRPQRIWLDLEVEIDASKAAAQDDIAKALDYAQLVVRVKDHLQQTSFQLMETLAENVAALLLREFGVRAVTVRVKKRSLPDIDYAAVEVVRRA